METDGALLAIYKPRIGYRIVMTLSGGVLLLPIWATVLEATGRWEAPHGLPASIAIASVCCCVAAYIIVSVNTLQLRIFEHAIVFGERVRGRRRLAMSEVTGRKHYWRSRGFQGMSGVYIVPKKGVKVRPIFIEEQVFALDAWYREWALQIPFLGEKHQRWI